MNAPSPTPAYISRAARRAQQRRARADELRAATTAHDIARSGYLTGTQSLSQLQQAAVRLMRARVPAQRAKAQWLYCLARRITDHRLIRVSRNQAGHLLANSNYLVQHIATLETTSCSQS